MDKRGSGAFNESQHSNTEAQVDTFQSLMRAARGALLLCGVIAVASCGGGGGGGGSTALQISNSDTFAGVLTSTGDGLWNDAGTGGDSGGADGGGAAGVGEFVDVSIRFPASSGSGTGTMTWRILRSDYGLAGTSGQASIVKDGSVTTAEHGGYKIVGAPANQGNLFVSKTGQISGSIPLTIKGATVYTSFTALRYKDSLQTVTNVVGVYSFGILLADPGTGANPDSSYGSFHISTDGTGRICPDVAYSDACSGGINVTTALDDPSNPRVIKITSSAPDNIVGYAVARQYNGVVYMTIDLSLVGTDGKARTGVMYAARSSGTFDPSSMAGAWSFVGHDLGHGISSFTGRLAVRDFGSGNVQFRPTDVNGACDTTGMLMSSGFQNGVGLAHQPGQANAQVIPLGEDLAIHVTPTGGSEPGTFALLRRYSTDYSKAGSCTP